MNLPQKIKNLRKKNGLSQLELAEKLIVSRQAISGWEAGTSKPSTENLQRLSSLFNIPLEILLDDTAEAEFTEAPEKIPEKVLSEEGKRETEQEKPRMGKQCKSLAIAITISLLLILIAVAILIQKEVAQENSDVLSFGEMENDTMGNAEGNAFGLDSCD